MKPYPPFRPCRRRSRRSIPVSAPEGRGFVEGLESRQLLSATSLTVTPAVLAQPDSTTPSASATYSNPTGYTPAQIASAYGLNQVVFSTKSGAVAGDGTGQTIAIVDAYNDPKIASDLATFDARYLPNSAPISSFLSVVNQNGGSTLPATNPGWAGEIALDVEWAHAAAPGAKILLVEANSATLGDLLAGVNYARHAAGVSVVSMSWGAGEFAGESAYDSMFTTPAGHQGVTFVAASGDEGPFSGAEWPAVSPNVLSVGGTSLHLQSAAGGYGSESAWSLSTGGTSTFESRPAYQSGLPTADTQLTVFSRFGVSTVSRRSTPDVSFDADPSTGFSVYDSVPYQGYSGWQVVGGTSAGAPQWAALVAVADQGRVLAGKATLDGGSQTLPALYSLYAGPGTTGFAAYSADFRDVAGGPSFSPVSSGYDQATGLGSPRAVQVVGGLVASGASGSSAASGTTASTSTAAAKKNAASGAGSRAGGAADSRVAPPLPTAQTALVGDIGAAFAGRAESTSTAAALAAGGVGAFGDKAIVAGAPAAGSLPSSSGTGADRVVLSLPLAIRHGDGIAAAVEKGLSVLAEGGSGFAGAANVGTVVPQALTSLMGAGLSSGVSSDSAPLLSADNPLRLAEPVGRTFAGTLLNLAPATWLGAGDDSRGWEIFAGACLGVAVAGYGYTAAITREERRRVREAGGTRSARRVPGGWELLPQGSPDDSELPESFEPLERR